MSLLLNIFLPTTCIYCRKLTARVCYECEPRVGSDPRLVFRENFIGFSSMTYNSDAKLLLRAFKELGESSLGKLMAQNMFPLIECFQNAPTILVPVPSNRNSLRARGLNPAEVIARELTNLDRNLRFQNLLARTRQTQDQSKLSVSARKENQRESMIASAAGASVLLVDDVVTTGSTLLAAKESLEKAGNSVVGFLTFAETESKKE